jgi:predicted SnoaL-like aldol condensation-catalyzing enzyme
MSVQFRLVTRYATTSAEAADANQTRVEAVFAELQQNKPDNVSYLVLRLADGSFVHVSFHGHDRDGANPISGTAAFGEFQAHHGEIRAGDIDQQPATLVGAYLTVID